MRTRSVFLLLGSFALAASSCATEHENNPAACPAERPYPYTSGAGVCDVAPVSCVYTDRSGCRAPCFCDPNDGGIPIWRCNGCQ